MKIAKDNWLSGVWGHDVFRIDVAASDQGAALGDYVSQHICEQKQAFYFTKIDTAQIEQVRTLSRTGLFVVDVNVTFQLDRVPVLSPPPFPVVVREVRDEDAEAVLAIAGSAFRYSRFHLDPLVADELANRIKREWIANYVRKVRGDKLLVALVNGKPVGFLAAIKAESHGQRLGIIDLIAVAGDQQKRRVGEALVMAFAEGYRPQCDLLQVGTQVANAAAARFYEKLGFSMKASQYVMHLHVRDGSPQ